MPAIWHSESVIQSLWSLNSKYKEDQSDEPASSCDTLHRANHHSRGIKSSMVWKKFVYIKRTQVFYRIARDSWALYRLWDKVWERRDQALSVLCSCLIFSALSLWKMDCCQPTCQAAELLQHEVLQRSTAHWMTKKTARCRGTLGSRHEEC